MDDLRTCVECGTRLNSYNGMFRCLLHLRLHSELQFYVESREIETVGLERWAKGQTTKSHLRRYYVKALKTHGVIPWDAHLSEIAEIDPGGASQMVSTIFGQPREYADLDRALYALQKSEAQAVESFYPESNLLTKWVYATRGEKYVRFRSAAEL